MNKESIIEELNEIFEDTLDLEDVEITAATKASDIEEWDSLTHIMLVVAVEKHFKVKFTSQEILSWKDVGEMVNCIVEK